MVSGMELDMTKGSPVKLIIKFIIPLIIGNIFQQLYTMIDTIIVGQFVGVDALAAVGATGTIVFLILGFMQGLATGFSMLTAQRFGAGDEEGIKRSVGMGIVLSVIATVMITIISIRGMDFLLTVMNTPEDIYDMAKEYVVIICIGIGCTMLYNLLSSFLRAIGNSKIPLLFLGISAVLNIMLDLLFILVFHGGVAGAAYATIIAQGVSGILCLIYIVHKIPILCIRKEHLQAEWYCIGRQISMGIPMALQFSITAVGAIIVQSALNRLGTMAVASYTVAMKIEQFNNQPLVAMGVTMATYAAQNRGVWNVKRIKQGVKIANAMSAVYAVVSFGIIWLLLPHIVPLFVHENIAVVLHYAKIYIFICGTCFFPLGMIFIFRNAMQGCGYGFLPMMGGVVELVSRCAAAFVAARYKSYEGVCLANAGAWVTAGLFLFVAYLFVIHRVQKKALLEQQSGTEPEGGIV